MGIQSPRALEGAQMRTVWKLDQTDILVEPGPLVGPRGYEVQHLLSALITSPLEGNIECTLVLAAAIPLPDCYF